MRLSCELELTYSLAVSSSSIPSRSSRSRAVITLGKKPGPAGSGARREEMFLIVSTAKNLAGSKYKARQYVNQCTAHARTVVSYSTCHYINKQMINL